MTETFLEKYRPSDFNSPYLISTDAVNQIKNMDINALPNLLFTGPPGTGKTTIAKIIAKTLHSDTWERDTLEVNASNEFKIDSLRKGGMIRDFIRTVSMNGKKRILWLEEIDAPSVNKAAQNGLRRPMEMYSKNCLFILTANNKSKVLDAIQSRCKVIEFKKPTLEQLKIFTERIATAESIALDSEVVEKIVKHANGDFRVILNTLQANKPLSPLSVNNISFPTSSGNAIWDLLQRGSNGLHEARALAFDGDYYDLIVKLRQCVLDNEQLGNGYQSIMLIALAKYENRLSSGTGSYIQIDGLLSELYLLLWMRAKKWDLDKLLSMSAINKEVLGI